MMKTSVKPKIYCLFGPTASGKSELALNMAAEMTGVIISVDSAMVYRGMNIGTAKPGAEVLKEYPHALINIRDPWQSYSAADFCDDVTCEIEKSLQAKRIPLLVGGTMLYFHALQNGLSELPNADPTIRAVIETEAKEKGWETLHQELTQIDPKAAERIHVNDPQRIQRALEVYRITGESMSTLWEQSKPTLDDRYEFINIALVPSERSELHQRIAVRFDTMLENGLIDEVKLLMENPKIHRDLPAMRSVGYRQVWDYLSGDYDQETLREKGIVATRRLAKRQLTWLRHWRLPVEELNYDSENLLEKIRIQCQAPNSS